MIGEKFGRLTVIERINIKYKYLCKCMCDCGNEIITRAGDLRSGHTKSCGCLRKETSSMVGMSSLKHGHAAMGKLTKEYNTWIGMRRRCYDPKTNRYEYYGGKGIKVCNRWLDSFENFLVDMGLAPTAEHSIDRIDGDGDYEPSNCRWANVYEQRANRG